MTSIQIRLNPLEQAEVDNSCNHHGQISAATMAKLYAIQGQENKVKERTTYYGIVQIKQSAGQFSKVHFKRAKKRIGKQSHNSERSKGKE
jgi:hypothetical protein